VRENRTHGSTGGGWKRDVTLRHRASPRPYDKPSRLVLIRGSDRWWAASRRWGCRVAWRHSRLTMRGRVGGFFARSWPHGSCRSKALWLGFSSLGGCPWPARCHSGDCPLRARGRRNVADMMARIVAVHGIGCPDDETWRPAELSAAAASLLTSRSARQAHPLRPVCGPFHARATVGWHARGVNEPESGTTNVARVYHFALKDDHQIVYVRCHRSTMRVEAVGTVSAWSRDVVPESTRHVGSTFGRKAIPGPPGTTRLPAGIPPSLRPSTGFSTSRRGADRRARCTRRSPTMRSTT
jgi:hypothetical protein